MERYLNLLLLLASITVKSEQKSIVVSSGSSVSTSCIDGKCRTCIDGECYSRGYSQINTYGGRCPAVACEDDCDDVVMFSDKCPICRCSDGTGSRQPCNTDSDCTNKEASCVNNLCTYKNVPNNLPKACRFDYECDSNQTCSEMQCKDGAKKRHAKGVSCVFPNNCPSGFGDCRDMTCYESKQRGNHVQGITCVYRNQCPSGYTCDQRAMTCVESHDGRTHYMGLSCVFDMNCPDNYECEDGTMTCFEQ